MNLYYPLSPIQQVECSLEEDLSKELIDVTDAGQGIIGKKELQPDDADEINETVNALNRQVAELERGTREKKDRQVNLSLLANADLFASVVAP